MQYNVEDTKAGKMDRGRLLVTTLRIIWVCDRAPHINLSIGMHSVTKLDMSNKARSGAHPVSNRLRALTAAHAENGGRGLCMMCP